MKTNIVEVEVDDSGIAVLSAGNKLLAFEFCKESVLVLSRILSTHHGLKTIIPIKEGYSLLDTAIEDIISKLEGTYSDYPLSSSAKHIFYLYEDNDIYLGYDVEDKKLPMSALDFEKESDFFNEIVVVMYNNFIHLSAEYLEMIYDVSEKPLEFRHVVDTYIQSIIHEYYNNLRFSKLNDYLWTIYDSIVHEQYPDTIFKIKKENEERKND